MRSIITTRATIIGLVTDTDITIQIPTALIWAVVPGVGLCRAVSVSRTKVRMVRVGDITDAGIDAAPSHALIPLADELPRQALANVYFEDLAGAENAAKLLTRNEARRSAVHIATLPDLLRRDT